MDWITEQVAIGNYLEAQNAALLREHGFRSVLSLDGTLRPDAAGRLGVAVVAAYRLIDGAGNDPRVVGLARDDLGRLVREHPPVLVHCHAGRSRSVAVVAAYLMRHLDLGPEEAIAAVAARRAVNVSSELVDLLDQLSV